MPVSPSQTLLSMYQLRGQHQARGQEVEFRKKRAARQDELANLKLTFDMGKQTGDFTQFFDLAHSSDIVPWRKDWTPEQFNKGVQDYQVRTGQLQAGVNPQTGKPFHEAPATTLQGVLARGEKFTPEQQKAWGELRQGDMDKLLRAQGAALDKQIQAIDDDINRTNLEIAKLDPIASDESIPRLNAELERLQNRRAALYQGKQHLGLSVPEQFLPETADGKVDPLANLREMASTIRELKAMNFTKEEIRDVFKGAGLVVPGEEAKVEPKKVNGKVVSKKTLAPLSQEKTGLSPAEIDKQYYQRGQKVKAGVAGAWGQLKAVRPVGKPPDSPFSRMFQ